MSNKLYQFSYELERQHRTRISIIALTVVVVFLVIELSLAYFIFPVRQTSVSMNPDLESNSCVLVTPLDKNPDRGSVILLKPLNEKRLPTFKWLVNTFSLFFTARQFSPFINKEIMGDNFMLRRVIGIPGDTLYMRDYVTFVKPQNAKHFLTEFELVEKPYNVNITVPPANWEEGVSVSGNYETITLKDGQYFVLGDNRLGSLDSRVWGIIDSSRIAGSALMIYYPFSSFGKL